MKKLVFLVFMISFAFIANGQVFFQMNTGPSDVFSSISHCGNNIFIGTNKKIIRSNDLGVTWQQSLIVNNNPFFYINKIIFSGNVGLALSSEKTIFCTNNGGDSWNEIQINGQYTSLQDICFGPNQNEAFLLVEDSSGNGGYILKSIDYGVTWNNINSCIWQNYIPVSMCWKNDTAYVGIRAKNNNNQQISLLARLSGPFFSVLIDTLSSHLLYLKSLQILHDDLIIYGVNSSMTGCIGKKNIKDNLNQAETYFNSLSLNWASNLYVSNNYEAVFSNFQGQINSINLSGDIGNTMIQNNYYNQGDQFVSVDVVNGFTYAVGVYGLAKTNNTWVTTSISENLNSTPEIICQNPFSEELKIKSYEKGILQIYSIDGKIVFESIKADEEIKIFTADFPKRMYIIKINEKTKKICKQ
jgi:hypothetical protein